MMQILNNWKKERRPKSMKNTSSHMSTGIPHLAGASLSVTLNLLIELFLESDRLNCSRSTMNVRKRRSMMKSQQALLTCSRVNVYRISTNCISFACMTDRRPELLAALRDEWRERTSSFLIASCI